MFSIVKFIILLALVLQVSLVEAKVFKVPQNSGFIEKQVIEPVGEFEGLDSPKKNHKGLALVRK